MYTNTVSSPLYSLSVLTNITVCPQQRECTLTQYGLTKAIKLNKKQSSNTAQWIITELERNIVSNLSKDYDLLEPNS